MRNWAAVVDAVTALPGTGLGTAYGKPAVKVGKHTLAALTAPDLGSFVLHTTLEEKKVLLAADPDTFWQTDHYLGWPVVLVRFGTGAGDRIALLLARGWWDRAGAASRKAYGDRP